MSSIHSHLFLLLDSPPELPLAPEFIFLPIPYVDSSTREPVLALTVPHVLPPLSDVNSAIQEVVGASPSELRRAKCVAKWVKMNEKRGYAATLFPHLSLVEFSGVNDLALLVEEKLRAIMARGWILVPLGR